MPNIQFPVRRLVTIANMADLVTPIKRAYLSSQVASALEERVKGGEYAAGGKLPSEAQMCVQYGVSRSVIREALSRLKSRGLITSEQGRGVFVSSAAHIAPLSLDPKAAVSAEAVLGLLELRTGFEMQAAVLAARRRTTAQLKRIKQCLGRVKPAVRLGGEGIAEDFEFHCAVCEATDNEYFLAIERFLFQYARVGSRVSRSDPAKRAAYAADTDKEHAALYQAIAAQNEAAAALAAQAHVEAVTNRIRGADQHFWVVEAQAVAGSLVQRRGLLTGC